MGDYDVVLTTNKHAYARVKDDRIVLSIPRRWRHDTDLQHRLYHKLKSQLVQREKHISVMHTYDDTYIWLWGEKVLLADYGLEGKHEKEIYRHLGDMLGAYATPLIHEYADRMGKKVDRIHMRKVVSKWWSCTSHARIMLNTSLIHLPQVCTDYVIVHECCHLVHHHHGPAFWELVEHYYPGYKEIEKMLRGYRLR